MHLYYYLIVIVIISFITMCFYISDKHKAKKGKWRIPEKVLLSLSFFGGAIGGLIGMYVFRHKTKHWYFVVINILGFIWQISLGIYLLYQFGW